MEISMPATQNSEPRLGLTYRLAAAWVLGFFALALAAWTGEFIEQQFGAGNIIRTLTQSAVMAGLVLFGIVWMRKRIDQRPLGTMGLVGPRKATTGFLMGAGIIFMPLFLTLLFTGLFGWATIELNLSRSAVLTFLVGFVAVLFFEALPEEILFRGYLYSNLNTAMSKWKASAVTVGLFVLLPSLLVPFQRYILGMEVYVGGASYISPSYIITMILFGVFLQYLRILTASVWMGIGFHLSFVLINRILGPEPSNLIYISDVSNQTPMIITASISVLLILTALLFYPKISGHSLGLKEKVSLVQA
jgi:membrane protease YdiL (CAAX protease family)